MYIVVEVVARADGHCRGAAAHCLNYACAADTLRVVRVERVERVGRVAADAWRLFVADYYVEFAGRRAAADIGNGPCHMRGAYLETLSVEGCGRRSDCSRRSTEAVDYRLYAYVVAGGDVPGGAAVQIVVEVF